MKKTAPSLTPDPSPVVQPYAKNPRYLEYHGKPIVAVGASEHYGAVLNSDFDYVPYLEELTRHGLNYVRIFSGIYRELPDGTPNTLAPREEAFLCPWKRLEGTESTTPRLIDIDGGWPGTPTWDAKQWEARYWERLVQFCQEAQQRHILVEYVLFHQDEELSRRRDNYFASPLYFRNQKNSPVSASSLMAYDHVFQEYRITIMGPEWAECRNEYLPWMESFVRKAAEELAPFENVYFCVLDDGADDVVAFYNGVQHTEEWQHWCCDLLQRVAPERMVAVHWQNRTGLIEKLHPAVTIASFHEALSSAALANYHLGRVIASSETRHAASDPASHRKAAWCFFCSGGGMFCHLDRSFTVEQPSGSAGDELRKQLGYMRRILQENRLWTMHPANEYLIEGDALVMQDNYNFLLYLPQGGSILLADFNRSVEPLWFDPVACRMMEAPQEIKAGIRFSPPEGLKEAVLVLKKTVFPI